MSLTPEKMTPENIPSFSPEAPPEPALGTNGPRRPNRLLILCFAIFTFEIGLFLVILPWRYDWTLNYFQGLTPTLEDIWDEPSFRGAITGLGLVNIYISLLQLARLFRRIA